MKNFEKYKNQNDLIKAFFKNRSPSSISVSIVEEFVKWREMEAEEEKILPCPFCGSNANLFHAVDGRHAVHCTDIWRCKYMSGEYASDEEAIANHNMVARCVKNEKKK